MSHYVYKHINKKNGHISPRKGVTLSEETKLKISKSLIGNIPWNKGLKSKNK